jgi:diadenosine tetraphosphate (Ap4A) HIT family hydrolase
MTHHATLTKFGYPETAVADFNHWVVVYRRQQVTLGSLVLIAKSGATSFAGLPSAAYAELEQVTRRIEAALTSFRTYDRINYIMLMMVDPQVHFHVIPRYREVQELAGVSFADSAWPGPPDFKSGVTPEAAFAETLIRDLAQAFQTAA